MMHNDLFNEKLDMNYQPYDIDTYEDEEEEWEDGMSLGEYLASRPVHFA